MLTVDNCEINVILSLKRVNKFVTFSKRQGGIVRFYFLRKWIMNSNSRLSFNKMEIKNEAEKTLME